jgi:tRNA dimethylallyltransferase
LSSSRKNKTVIIIVGPTAVGKTSIAIGIAKLFNTEIISADSRQCYRELKIGVARPSDNELKEIPHHFIATNSIEEKISTASFEQYALQTVQDLFRKHDVIVMTGGTGLYIKAFTEGLDEIPEVPEDVREEIAKQYHKNGITWLQNQIQKKDPQFYRQGEMKNPQRMMRALEVVEATGKSIFDFRNQDKPARNFNVIKIGLKLPKEELHRNISSRVDDMIKSGLVEEVKSLLPFKNFNALQTVGYSEIIDYLEGKKKLDEAIEEIKKNTRQYAKRQMTWFRKDKNIHWFEPGQLQEIKSFISSQLLPADARP